MADNIKIDTREFNKAMIQYKAASNKDFADVANHALGNLALRAAQYSPTASKAEISALEGRDWWPKFISKIISGGGQSLHLRRKARGEEAKVYWTDPATGQLRYGRKTVGYDREVTSGSKVADKRRLSKKIIRQRIETVKSFVAVFSWVAAKFKPYKVSRIGGKTFDRVVTRMATPAKPEAIFGIPFVSNRKYPRPDNMAQVSGKVRIASRALEAAMAFVVRDLMQYVDRKLGKTADKYSARAA